MRIDETSGIVLFQAGAELSYKDWERDVVTAIAATHGRIRRVLSDRRRMKADYQQDIAERAAEYLRAHARDVEDARWAILTNPVSAAYYTASAAQTLLEASQVHLKVFVELPAALRWLLGAYEDEELQRLQQWVDNPKNGS
jgi:hypothetical protein